MIGPRLHAGLRAAGVAPACPSRSPRTTMSARRNILKARGLIALYLSATLFAFVSLFVKLAAPYYSGLFISASRFAVGVAPLPLRPLPQLRRGSSP